MKATPSKARKAEIRKAKASKMNPELQRKIAKIGGELQEILINLRAQAHKVQEECDLEHGSPALLVRILAREAERQCDDLRELAGDY